MDMEQITEKLNIDQNTGLDGEPLSLLGMMTEVFKRKPLFLSVS